MVQRSLVIIRIEFNQECSCLNVLVVFNFRIEVENRAANASADAIQMPIDLRVIGGLKTPGVQPPGKKDSQGDHGNNKQRPSWNSSRSRYKPWSRLSSRTHMLFSRSGRCLRVFFNHVYSLCHVICLRRNPKNGAQRLPWLAPAPSSRR